MTSAPGSELAVPAPSRDLIRRLRATGAEVLAGAPNVNHGGCAVYASHVAQALEARGLTCWGVLTSSLRDDDLHVVRNQSKPRTLREWNDAGVLIGHIMLQFENAGRVWSHDARNTCTGRIKYEPTYGGRLVPGYMTVPELAAIASRPSGWNPAFCRRSGVPVIRAAVRRHLLDY
jgi:hypothetical protein